WITFFFGALLLRCAVDDQKDSALRADDDATQTKSTLRAAIGAKEGEEYDVLISGPKNIDRVAVCVAKTAEECKDDQTKTFLATLAKAGEPRIFKSERKVKIEAGLRLMVLARDAAGEKVDDLVAEFRAKGDDGFETYTEGMALAETLTLKGPVAYRV